MRDDNPATLRGTLDALGEYVWHALKLVTVIVLSILIWSVPAWLVGQLVRLGITPSPAEWVVLLENGVVVVLLVSFLAYVVESEAKLHLYNARELRALYRELRQPAPRKPAHQAAGSSDPNVEAAGD